KVQPRSYSRLRMKLRPVCIGRETIERTDILAHVAAKHPFTDRCPKLTRNLALVFDRQVGDALPRIQPVRCCERISRTSINAAMTSAATDCDPLTVRRQLQVKQYLGKKKPRTLARLQQICVLAEESQPRTRRDGSLQKRNRVHKATSVNRTRGDLFDLSYKLLQARFHNVVVVESPGVARHAPVTMLVLKSGRR